MRRRPLARAKGLRDIQSPQTRGAQEKHAQPADLAGDLAEDRGEGHEGCRGSEPPQRFKNAERIGVVPYGGRQQAGDEEEREQKPKVAAGKG